MFESVVLSLLFVLSSSASSYVIIPSDGKSIPYSATSNGSGFEFLSFASSIKLYLFLNLYINGIKILDPLQFSLLNVIVQKQN